MKRETWHILIAYLLGSFFGLMQVWAIVSGLVRPRPTNA